VISVNEFCSIYYFSEIVASNIWFVPALSEIPSHTHVSYLMIELIKIIDANNLLASDKWCRAI
jgi:hypothetical protein